jgi:hypothetical protein
VLFAGQRLVGLALARQHAHQRILAQLVVVVEVFVTQRQGVDALCQHLLQTVLATILGAEVLKAQGQSLQDSQAAVGLS